MPKGHSLGGDGGVRVQVVVGGDEARNVGKRIECGKLAGPVGHWRDAFLMLEMDSVSVLDCGRAGLRGPRASTVAEATREESGEP